MTQEQPRLPVEERPVLLIIDGHAVVHRAFHAFKDRPLNARNGERTEAVFGFINSLLKALADVNPAYCAVAFDLPTPTFRDTIFADYKAQRPPAPDELKAQFKRVRQVVKAFGIPIYEVEGFEADDVLGTLAQKATAEGMDTVILTGDTDTLQLVSPHVRVRCYAPPKDYLLYDENQVRQRYGLTPSQLIGFKALKGDPSDNIPGVPGVGEKTAVKLLQQFGTLENLLGHLDVVEPAKLQAMLLQHQADLRRNLELVTINTQVGIDFDKEKARFGSFDRGQVMELMREMEFNAIVPRIPQSRASAPVQGQLVAAAAEPQEQVDYRTVTTIQELEALVKELQHAETFAFDTETSGLNAMATQLVGLSFTTKPGTAWYVPVGHREGRQLPEEVVLKVLKPVLEDARIPKVAHNANFDMLVLANHGIWTAGIAFDTMVAAHLLGEKALGLKGLAFNRLGKEMTRITQLIGTGKDQRSMAQVAVEEAAPYASADADMTFRLREIFEPQLHKIGSWQLFAEVEMPLVPVLVRMEQDGIAMDAGFLRRLSSEMGEEISALEAQVYDLVGHHFNINSPKQLGDVLFQELRLPGGRRTKTGYSTDASVLEALGDAHPVLKPILRYRELTKLKSTYLDALPTLVNPRTGRVHTSLNQTGSATGRVSSNDPNLQNIPIRTEVGRQVRRAFVAQGAPDWLLLSADYSQIDLRVLAHLSQDENLITAFKQGEDIHKATASLILGVPIESINADQRRLAKTVNFGIVYGMSNYGLFSRTELTMEQSAEFIEKYFQRYPGVKVYMERTKQQARELGYVQTLLGRRRYTPDIRASNYAVRQGAEREAINAPVQGTSAEIVKIAMIRIYQRMQELGLRSRMLLQVHDELLFEVPKEELPGMEALVQEVMPHARELSVPLVVDTKKGYNWEEMG